MTCQRFRLVTCVIVALLLLNFLNPAAAQNQETQSLVLGKPIERELVGEQAHTYLVDLAASDFLHVIVEQRGVDVLVIAYAPNRSDRSRIENRQ